MTEPSSVHRPDLRDLIMLEVPYEVKVSPDGSKAAILARTTNWKDNAYETVCYVKDLEGREPRSLPRRMTRSGSVSQVEWMDDANLALLKTAKGEDKAAQVWIYENLTGDGWQVTDHKDGVSSFKPFAGGLLFLAKDPERAEKKKRTDQFGKFQHFEQEESTRGLYYTSLEALREYEAQKRRITEEESKGQVRPVVDLSRLLPGPLHILSIVPAPDGKSIYLNCQRREDFVYWQETSTFRLELDAEAALSEDLRRARGKAEEKGESGTSSQSEGETDPAPEDFSYLGTLKRLDLPSLCTIEEVSPDNSRLLLSFQGRDSHFYTQSDLWLMDVSDALSVPDAETARGKMRCLTSALDRQVLQSCWVPSGIFCSFPDGTVMRVACFQDNGQFETLDFQGYHPASMVHTSLSGKIGFVATNTASFPEACVATRVSVTEGDRKAGWNLDLLTCFGEQVKGWELGTVQTIRWTSRDGTQIEGVLRKPANFDPSRRYPLAFVVHGGPTWYSPEYTLTGDDLAYYPSLQLVNQDVLVLKPNYRGSIGRGQAFLELNVNNLGVGDLWDLESAIDHLDQLGWIDPGRIGCMGWSQGGYISAFAGLRSDRFSAVSVGAGISDWYTYHISNDIPHFTTEYLSASPFRDRSLYAETAPISGLPQAKTPVLIQHGSDDQRVPLSNAKELYRGLKEMNVPVELFIFPGMGHPIVKPRENHAVMHQNLAWFEHYLLGKELDLDA